jgi:microcystin-dependent protein
LLCNGTAVSRTSFAALFAVIGTTFGVGDNSTTFNLPNFNNRTPVGAGGLYSLGATGGSKDAAVVTHTHSLSGGSASGTFLTGASVSTTRTNFNTEFFGTQAVTNVSLSTSTGSPSYTNPTVQSAGSSGTDANMPPYLAINYIIKT